RSFGIMAGPVRVDLPVPMIATRDIGAAAAEALVRLDFRGQQTQELLGTRDVTYTEAAKIIGTAIGKPDLTYTQLPDEQVIEAMNGVREDSVGITGSGFVGVDDSRSTCLLPSRLSLHLPY